MYDNVLRDADREMDAMMNFYLVRWPHPDGLTRWGQQTDWVVRASTAVDAIEHIKRTVKQDFKDELTIEYINQTSPLPETILWYGPDA